MIRVAIRQIRSEVAALIVAVGVFVAVLLLDRPHIPNGSTDVFDLVTRVQRDLHQAGLVVLAVLPPLVGAFLGAPLVAREVENGTHRLIWSQSITRRRWLVIKVATAGAAVVVATGTASLAVTRWARLLDGATGERGGGLPSRLTPIAFAMRGVVPIGYALFALVLGVLLGTVLRRTLPAMALTILVVASLQIVVPIWVRPHLLAPTEVDLIIDRDNFDGLSSPPTGGSGVIRARTADHKDWIIDQDTVDATGRAAALPAEFLGCVRAAIGGPDIQAAPGGRAAFEECLAELGAAGYRQHLVFAPAARFWALQWRELALYLTGAGMLLAAAIARIRRV